jgi:hypothetical protein
MARPKLGKVLGKNLVISNQKKLTDPAARATKIDVRRRVLAAIGAADARVFDAFAASGEMHKAVWHEAAEYVGCDLNWTSDDRLAYVADNRRVMRCIDLAAFNIFDFDAFGSPWEQAVILAARRKVAPGERIGVVVTDGSSLNMALGGMPAALRELGGFIGVPAGTVRSHGEIMDRTIKGLCRRMGAGLVHRWENANVSATSRLRYVALVLEGAG